MTRLLLLAVALLGICEAFSPSMYSAQSVSQSSLVAVAVTRCCIIYFRLGYVTGNLSLQTTFFGIDAIYIHIPVANRTEQHNLA